MARILLIGVGVIWAAFVIGCAAFQRSLLYYPGHDLTNGGLAPWIDEGEVIGVSRRIPRPRAVWLMCHGNAGQAADRTYALPRFSLEDSVYILEYPGYGSRYGKPGKNSFNEAAARAYQLLRSTYPGIPVCVLGESIGSGPACSLASQPVPPDKYVLVVPFDRLADVASDHFPLLPMGLILRDRWDNVAAMKGYKGPVEIYAAAEDRVIDPRHARALADSVPQAKWMLLDGGHNDWSKASFQIGYP